MKKIIKQSSLIILAGIMTLTLGCGGSSSSSSSSSSSDFAPTSINGDTMNATITSGSGSYASTGAFVIVFGATTYVLTGGPGVDDSSGTYSYSGSGNSGSIAMTGSPAGGLTTAVVTFSSANAGSYVATGSAGATGSQIGIFTGF